MISDLLRESGWELTTIGEVAEINPRKPKYEGLKDDAPVGFIPMAAVDETRGVVTSVEQRPLGELRGKSYRTFASDDVLFAKITPCMENGKAAVVPRLPSGHGFGSTEFHVLRPSRRVDGRYLWHFVRQETYRREAERYMTGSVGQLRVPAEFIRDTELLLPPLSEQHRIVDLLDHIGRRSGAISNSLTEVCRILTNFRRAILVAACSGRLTENWRLEHPALSATDADHLLACRQAEQGRRFKEVKPNPHAPDSEIPEQWSRVPLGLLLRDLKYGTSKRSQYAIDGTPVLRIPNVSGPLSVIHKC